MDRYVATHGQVNASLWDESLSPREAIELTLRQDANRTRPPEGVSSCAVGQRLSARA